MVGRLRHHHREPQRPDQRRARGLPLDLRGLPLRQLHLRQRTAPEDQRLRQSADHRRVPHIWGNHAGPPQPAGANVGTANVAGASWDVWEGRLSNGGISWNVVSYVRQQGTNSLDVRISDFTRYPAQPGLVPALNR
ncbi:hypothetical protein ACGFZR_07420 [Streptomyces sp. NPDC048241]|uniref:GH12 family glycosyl hydrolase domain-containing protein n=1 Tax=Streptomyces sp. NPDC048241 TaxID=3365521 RepID=UPI00371963AA